MYRKKGKINSNVLELHGPDNIWMRISPIEIESSYMFIKYAKGKVGVVGLGLGYVVQELAKKSSVDEIIVYEMEKDVIDLVNKYELKNRVILSSFNHESIKISREIDSEFKTGLLYYQPIKDVVNYAKDFGANAIHPDIRLVSEELIKEAKENNIDVNIYTVNSPILMRKLISAGVSGVFTDYPDLLQEIINNG